MGGQALVSLNFSLGASDELRLFLHLQVKGSGQLSGLVGLRSLGVSVAEEIRLSGLVILSSSSELELTGVSELSELRSSLLCLVEVVVLGLDSVVLVSVLLSLHVVEVLKSVDLFSVTCALFFQLGELSDSGIDLSAESVTGVRLLGDISLGCEDLSLSS